MNFMPSACRGRPREFDVDQALAAALRVFWTKGYEGASLTDLTEAMGITRPSLYAAFGNKEALFRKALDLYEREKLAYIGEALEAPTSREVVERLLHGALAMQTSDCEPKGCMRVISFGQLRAGGGFDPSRSDGAPPVVAEGALRPHAAREGRRRLAGGTDVDGLCAYVGAILAGMSIQAQQRRAASAARGVGRDQP